SDPETRLLVGRGTDGSRAAHRRERCNRQRSLVCRPAGGTAMIPVFIGWDPREAIAADVCRFSLLRRSSVPLHVQYLRQPALREIGLYRRERELRDGQGIDRIDGRPFSTEFAFTRFLVPALCQFEGWALFVDGDFLFLAD